MKLRVWHIPQVPMKPFIVEVASVEEGGLAPALLGVDYLFLLR